MLVFITGYMGSGKSTTGEKIARKLGFEFADIDTLIEQKHKKTIARIFEEKGENYFREAEQKILRSVFKLTNTVVACGGGTPCFFDNMNEMKKNGATVYIRLSAGSLFHRLAQSKEKRPLIADMPDLLLMEYIINELHKRERIYETADIIIKGEDMKTEDLADQLKKFLKI